MKMGVVRVAQSAIMLLLRICFVLIFVLCTLPAFFSTLVTDLCGCAPKTLEGRRRRGRFIARLTHLGWRVALKACFWLQNDSRGLAALEEAGRGSRPVFFCVNHCSWLDTPFVCAFLPRRLVGDTKTLMASLHLRLPILGRLATAIGHMPVPFTSRDLGNFSTDREKMAKTMARVDEHLSAGGHLAIFPEGDLNRQWQTLKPFRAGGFEVGIRHDAEVWAWIMTGTAEAWPPDGPLGGAPARISHRTFLLYPSAREAAEALAPGASLQDQARALAASTQAAMQEALVGLLADAAAPESPSKAYMKLFRPTSGLKDRLVSQRDGTDAVNG